MSMIAFLTYLTIVLRITFFIAVLYCIFMIVVNPTLVGEFVADVINGFNGRIL